ncbi:hypothetical protein [Streptomyces sp. S.PB5]|uniref:hypothetical protein n=1 Tax=Streptomyces sp. S.PB5 TaxID=3020844 RepID=UPI0025AFCF57|nr:hypothetical protein [Streptomyces sp. S.PB5]MDN3025432.1 hypothetical protein [Streptomyces sp. S.PB5]
MTRAPRGATGCWDGGDEPLPDTDIGLFRTACWEAARRVRGRVEEVSLPGGVRSFHVAALVGHGDPHVVVCHAHLPSVAFLGEPPVPGRPLSRFADPPPWSDVFEHAGLRPLPVEYLATPMSRVDVSELADAELRQMRYWRPEVLGDLLFNWWD